MLSNCRSKEQRVEHQSHCLRPRKLFIRKVVFGTLDALFKIFRQNNAHLRGLTTTTMLKAFNLPQSRSYTLAFDTISLRCLQWSCNVQVTFDFKHAPFECKIWQQQLLVKNTNFSPFQFQQPDNNWTLIFQYC